MTAEREQPPEDEGAAMLARHLEGDPRAFEELVASWGPRVYGFLRRSGAGEQADDLFQETFLRVHLAAGRFDPRYPFRVWVFTIARRLVIGHQRGQRVRRWLGGLLGRRAEGPEADPAEAPDPGPDQERAAAAREEAARLGRALTLLPAGPRQALVLVKVEGLSLEEAALVLDAPVPTVKTWVRRGRLALAEALEPAP
jgi:RNA polymerase sigma-70 factor (ECF subfamily)